MPSARAWSDVATRAQRATVGILAGDRYGAGIIVDRAGLVLTNLHVIQGIERISALLFDGATVPVSVVARAADLDLALLQLSKNVPESAELGSSRAVRVGDDVLAVGSPRKMYFSVSRGMVSYLNRKLDKVSYIQTDLPINAGNSGGPLLDRDGRVIGVVSFILRDSQGLAFALPIDYAKERFAQQLDHALPVARADISAGFSSGGGHVAENSVAENSVRGNSVRGNSVPRNDAAGNAGATVPHALTSGSAARN
ncbi:MAG TPA: trypsin-like peptidase domain-containing protein [Polyangiaceae bacterium]|nr:trypsin-like peptidase domain-containing protein [Polyangiaceae bacterium]